MLRPGNAGSNTAADHVEVIDLALAQIPDAHQHGCPVLVRADGAGCSKGWLAHLGSLRADRGLDVGFSVGFTMTAGVQDAILRLPEAAWTPAVDADGSAREGADVAALTGLLPDPLHVAARLVRGQRRLRLKIADHWPWRTQLAAAFQRLQALPRPQRI